MKRQAQKSRPSAAFLQEIGLFQTGHLLDGAFEVFIGATCARAFGRHGVDPGDGLGQDAVKAALVIGTFFPGCGVTNFRCAQQTCAVARVAVLGDDVVGALDCATTNKSNDIHPFAFFALNTDFAYRLKTFCDVIVRRCLSVDCPKGHYCCWYGQHFHN